MSIEEGVCRKKLKKSFQNATQSIDRAGVFAYNRTMGNRKQKKSQNILWKILSTVLCALWLAFIFTNSLLAGGQSSNQSSKVVALVQRLAKTLFPKGWIANAAGADYDKLHSGVRTLAHFSEFALLGVLTCWCYFTYTQEKAFVWVPALAIFCVPFLDEGLQLFAAGRVADFADIAVDAAGIAAGFAFALLLYVIVSKRSTHVRDELKK